MPRPTPVARRYAEAAFELATRDGTVDRWHADLRAATEMMADQQVARVVDNPSIPLAEREAAIGRLMGARSARPATNLVRILSRRGRMDALPAVTEHFGRLVDESRGVVAATVTSAAPLSDADVDRVRARVEAMTKSEVRLTAEVDPALIGGIIVRVGDTMIDASVRGRLERLREQLVAGA